MLIHRNDSFVELLGNAAWYLFELSNYDTSLQVLEIAMSACRDKDSLQYADLCNTAGTCYYELNQALNARTFYDTVSQIRQNQLAEDDIDSKSNVDDCSM